MMENSYPWAKALNVSEIDLERWQEEAPPKAHLLNWCLDHEKINPQEYYEWAKNHYNLAMLNEEFFKNPPNFELWKQIESVSNWSPNMVPIRQWDGVVFVACVEPQTQIPWSFPVQFLLAPRRELLNYWMNLHNQAPKVSTESQPQQKPVQNTIEPESASAQDAQPQPQPQPQPQAQAQAQAQAKAAKEAPEVPSAPKPQEASSPEPEVPDGFPSFEASRPSSQESPAGLDLSAQPEATSSEAPVGFDFDVSEGDSLKEDDLFSGFDQIPSAETQQEPLGMEGLASTTDEDDSAQQSPFEAFEAAEQPAKQPEEQPAVQEPVVSQSSTEAENMQPVVASEPEAHEEDMPSDLDEATAILNTTNITQKQNPLIGELKTRYQNVIILSQDNQQFTPYDWDSGLNVNRQAVDLSQPSFLKVVSRSKKPYHGYLADNQFHQNLFSSWGLEKLPEHITAVPIIEDSQIKHIVVAIGDEGCAGYQMIHFVESAIKNNPLLGSSSASNQAA